MAKLSTLNFDKKDILFICIIIFTAILLRAFYLSDYINIDIYPMQNSSDAYFYYVWAKDIASGNLFGGNEVFMKWPLYAYFLGFIFKVAGGNISIAFAIQFVLGSLNCGLVYLISRIIFSRFVAVVAAILCLSYGQFIFYDGILIYTTLSIFLNLVLFLFLLVLKENPGRRMFFLAGILLGVCVLTQGNTLVFGIAAITWLLWQNRVSFKKCCQFILFFSFGLLLMIGPVTLRNYLVEKDFVPVTGNLGVNFFIGNNPFSTGSFHMPADFRPTQEGIFNNSKIIARTVLHRDLKTSEVSSFWFNEAGNFIKHNPKLFAKLMMHKLHYLFMPAETIHDSEYSSLNGKIRLFNVLVLDLRLILPLAFLGMFFLSGKFKDAALLYIAVGCFSLSILAFFVVTRYRIVMVPFLAIFAAFATAEFWEQIKERKLIKLFSWAAFFILLVYLSNAGKESLAKGRQDQNIGAKLYKNETALIKEGKFNEALKSLMAHEKDNHNDDHLMDLIGRVYYLTRQYQKAEEYFQKSIRLLPINVGTYYDLGRLYNKQGRFREARDILKKAISLDPQNVICHYEIGKTYMEMGNYQEAKEHFEAAFKKINPWQTEDIDLIKNKLSEIKGKGRIDAKN